MRCGCIGLGAMGAPMARNLAEDGLLAAVYNRTPGKAEALAAELGVGVATDPANLAEQVDCVLLCVSADADVLEMVDAVAPAMDGGLVIDCSTVAADTAREAARRLAEHGCGFVDAPVSGGTEGAVKGTLAIMCGGEPADFQRARPVLGSIGARIAHMGAAGSGQATKAANQIAVAGVDQAVSEALAFAQAEGLPMDRVIEVLGSGAAASWFMTHRGPNMMRDEYPLGFKVSLHLKDLEIVRRMAADRGVSLPIVEMTLVHHRRLIEAGHGDSDISSLFTLKRAMFEGAGDGRED